VLKIFNVYFSSDGVYVYLYLETANIYLLFRSSEMVLSLRSLINKIRVYSFKWASSLILISKYITHLKIESCKGPGINITFRKCKVYAKENQFESNYCGTGINFTSLKSNQFC